MMFDKISSHRVELLDLKKKKNALCKLSSAISFISKSGCMFLSCHVRISE